jgi:hypothetical protein
MNDEMRYRSNELLNESDLREVRDERYPPAHKDLKRNGIALERVRYKYPYIVEVDRQGVWADRAGCIKKAAVVGWRFEREQKGAKQG